MADGPGAPDERRPGGGHRSGTTRDGLDRTFLRFLALCERVLLHVVALMLLATGAAIIVFMCVAVVRSPVSWTGKTIIVIEELLLVLIVVEIFVTVLTHLEGGRLQLEPFIIVGIVAVIRHILSMVVRLAVNAPPAESRAQYVELGVYAGVAFLLVVALAVARWSRRWPAKGGPDRQAPRVLSGGEQGAG
jgi:uncharacterized membrane protein (DUF373 family)